MTDTEINETIACWEGWGETENVYEEPLWCRDNSKGERSRIAPDYLHDPALMVELMVKHDIEVYPNQKIPASLDERLAQSKWKARKNDYFGTGDEPTEAVAMARLAMGE